MRANGGFTLIEMLAVLVIISILAFFLVTRLTGAEDTVKLKLARTKIENLQAAIEEYENEKGAYPASRFATDWGTPPNDTNLGSEALYVALWQKGIEGEGLKDDELVNADGDQSVKRLTVNPALELFELGDPWGNPIAYLRHDDYDRQDMYVTIAPSTGEPIDSQVGARKSKKTGNWQNPHKFQLISCGPDGSFGTEDDVANFSP